MRISTAAIAVKRARIRYSRLQQYGHWMKAGISPMSTAMQQHQEKEAIWVVI